MILIFLFLVSFLSVVESSYFLVNILKPSKVENSILYIVLLSISQIVVIVEILSILKQMNMSNILYLNAVTYFVCYGIWRYVGRNTQKKNSDIDFKSLINKEFWHNKYINTILYIQDSSIFKAIKRDKILLVLFLFFCFSGLICLFLSLFVPSNSWDSMAYHLARIGFWIQHKSLAHFETPTIRQTAFPVNSEIMMLWSIIFLKDDLLAQFNQYLAYAGSLFLTFTFLRYLKFSTRRTLWVIFILASLPAVILESCSTQTDIVIAFLLLCSLYLFIYGAREEDNISIIFSAIAYAIALGTKNTTLFYIPAFGIVYLIVAIRKYGKTFYKPILLFLSTIIPAFIILGSYNYILNILDWGNPFGPIPFIYKHSGSFGIKSFIVNIMKYFLFFIDFTGIKYAHDLSPIIIGAKNNLFSHLGLNSADGLAYRDIVDFPNHIHENHTTYGILGLILYLPLLFRSLIIKFKQQPNDKRLYIALAGFITVLFIIMISSFMGFCYWNKRYFTTAVILSAPVFALSYSRKNNPVKVIISLIAIVYYSFVPVFNEAKPLFKVIQLFSQENYDFDAFRSEARLRLEVFFDMRSTFFYPVKFLSLVAPDFSKIGVIYAEDDWVYPYFMENPTWQITSLRYEKLLEHNNYNDYDFLVIHGKEQRIDLVDLKSVNFNYNVVGGNIMFKPSPSNKSAYYMDRSGTPVTSGIPSTMFNIIDLRLIPKNFKLIKVINLGNIHYAFFIYRKIKNA